MQNISSVLIFPIPNVLFLIVTQFEKPTLYFHLFQLSLSSCTLRDCLESLLQPLKGPLLYLNLRDCRLSSTDLRTLLSWQGLTTLRELNLSRNSLGALSSLVSSILFVSKARHKSQFFLYWYRSP